MVPVPKDDVPYSEKSNKYECLTVLYHSSVLFFFPWWKTILVNLNDSFHMRGPEEIVQQINFGFRAFKIVTHTHHAHCIVS